MKHGAATGGATLGKFAARTNRAARARQLCGDLGAAIVGGGISANSRTAAIIFFNLPYLFLINSIT